MGSENNMVAVPDYWLRLLEATESLVKRTTTEAGFYREWSAADSAAFNARRSLARLAQSDAQQGASSPASGEGVGVTPGELQARTLLVGHAYRVGFNDGQDDDFNPDACVARMGDPTLLCSANAGVFPEDQADDFGRDLAARRYLRDWVPDEVRNYIARQLAALRGDAAHTSQEKGG
jgi:hypothetical protein